MASAPLLLEPLPPFVTTASILRRLATLAAPREPLTVSQWAERHLGYDPLVRPWQAEIMDALGDPAVNEVGLMGPAQTGKSEIGLAWIGYSIEHDPADIMVGQPDKDMARDFVVRRIEPMIARTPVLREAMLDTVNADNIFLKRFKGALLTTIWPVPAQFRARPVPRGWLDDYDQMPTDIGGSANEAGQGSAIDLLDGRQTTFKPRDTKFISSSPADDAGGGIEAFVAGGTDERLHPVCPECGDRIALDQKRDLRFDRGDPSVAAATAHVVCPANGCILEPSAQRELLDSLAELPARGFVASNPNAIGRRTFRVDGLVGFRSWSDIAQRWRLAEIAWETRQDEAPMRAFWQTVAGYNYRSQLSGEKPLEAAALAARREGGWKSGTLPAGARVVVRLVDVQADRFECADVAWGDGLESWLVDRWSIDVLADGITSIEPFRRPEDWQVLLPLFSRGIPLADGSGATVLPLTLAIDTGGGDRATEAAKQFWHAAVALGIPRNRITLIKGGNQPRGELMPRAKFSDKKTGGVVKRGSPDLWMPNVHAIKNIVDARLRREAPGPGYVHLPGNLADRYLEEMTAEELQKGKWTKLRPRNETWDLLVYAYAAILRPPFAQSRAHMRWVPPAFRVPDQQQPIDGSPASLSPRASTPPVSDEEVRPAPAATSTAAAAKAGADPFNQVRRNPEQTGNDWLGGSSAGGSWL